MVAISTLVLLETHKDTIYIQESNMSTVDSLHNEIYLRDSIIATWEDHAIRMKRICGLTDTVTWTYKEKVLHNICTKCLIKN